MPVRYQKIYVLKVKRRFFLCEPIAVAKSLREEAQLKEKYKGKLIEVKKNVCLLECEHNEM